MIPAKIILKTLTLALVITSAWSCGESDPRPLPTPPEQEYYSSMRFDGEERTFFVDLPQDYSSSASYPLLFVMHGGGQLGYEGVQGQSRLSELNDREDFIVVYPEGIRRLTFRTWNAGDCCPSATLLGTDDVGFIEALLEKLQTELSIDSKRVYAAGFSNGGQLAYKLANDLPHKFAAVSAVAGVLQQFPFSPARNVPIIHFHSYEDQTAPYFGGESDAPAIDLIFPSVDETLALIASQYNCNQARETVFSDPQTYDHFRYVGCDDHSLIELYVSQDGGHSWPGGQAFPGVAITDHFNASELMWEFFQNYSLPQ